MFPYRLENFSSVLKWFILMRMISAIFNPIDDCDEVYNFYEPVSLGFVFPRFGREFNLF